jgi:hypothetical protein
MSTPIANENGTNQSAMMYAPPWARDRDGARDEARDASRKDPPRKDARDEARGPSRKEVRETEVRDAACAALEDALRDEPLAASENALAASEQLRRTLPPASQLGERRTRWREPAPFEGDIAIVQLRERPSLEPVIVPAPRAAGRSGPSTTGVLTRVVGAVGLAALAAFFMVGTTPFSFAIKAEGETSPSLWSRLMSRSARPAEPAAQKSVMDAPVPQPMAPKAPAVSPTALAERFAAVAPAVEPPTRVPARPVQTVAVPSTPPVVAATPPVVAAAPPASATPAPAPAAAPEPSKTRALDADEIATLYRRSEELISQGDIAGGRLLLTRAAEAGDARSALALGATYDPSVLGKLGVLGVKPNPEKARAWYAKAAEFGSGEASRRLEVMAQGR